MQRYEVIEPHHCRSLVSGRYTFKVGDIIKGIEVNKHIQVELRNSTVLIPSEKVKSCK